MNFNCPSCDAGLTSNSQFCGERINCPVCDSLITIPHWRETMTQRTGIPRDPSNSDFAGKYTNHSVIAKGGMGQIISAVDTHLNRPVVIKKILEGNEDPSLVNQLLREAQVTARLAHPGVVPIHELGHDEDGRIYYTMKHVRGEPLDRVLDKLRLEDGEMLEKCPFQRLLLIFNRVCDTIGYANEIGIIHRDIKPDNIMLGPYGEYLVIDWGISKDLSGADVNDVSKVAPTYQYHPAPGDYGATIHGSIFGSPNYMSPEQAKGETDKIDARSDVFSLGALLYEMLTLSPPYVGGDLKERIQKAAECKIRPVEEIRASRPNPLRPWPHLPSVDIPQSVLAVAYKAMEENPDDRYQSATDMQQDIEAYLSGYTTGAEKAGVVKIVRKALGRNQAVANAMAIGLLLALGAVAFATQLIRNESLETQVASHEAAEVEKQLEDARADQQKALLTTAPEYARLARDLINEGHLVRARELAKLAHQYDPANPEAAALGCALDIHHHLHISPRQPGGGDPGPGFPSLRYFIDHPEELGESPGDYLPEQTWSRIAKAYREAGLIRLAGEVLSEQPARLENYRHILREAWPDVPESDWALSIEPDAGLLSIESSTIDLFPGFPDLRSRINQEYPGQILHLEILNPSPLMDFAILPSIPIESLAVKIPVELESLRPLSQCSHLKILDLESQSPTHDLAFIENLALISLRFNCENGSLSLEPLRKMTSLKVLVGGPGVHFTSLYPIAGLQLSLFSGAVNGGDFSPLSQMPLEFLAIKTEDKVALLGTLQNTPIQTFISCGVDLRNNWELISRWPLEVLLVENGGDMTALTPKTSLHHLKRLRINNGRWRGDFRALLPNLEVLDDKTGKNFGCFQTIETLRTMRIAGPPNEHRYLSPLLSLPEALDIKIRSDCPIQIFPAAVAEYVLREEWDEAGEAFQKLKEKVNRRKELAFLLPEIDKLEAMIHHQGQGETREFFLGAMTQNEKAKYRAVLCGLPRNKASELAESVGGKLASIDSGEDLDFLHENLDVPEPWAEELFWIGEHFEVPVSPFEPTENIVSAYRPTEKKFHSSHPRERRPFLIQWPLDLDE